MWKLIGASVPGTDHTMPGKPGWKNNQDAFKIYGDDHVTLGVVSDGCGSSPYSEIGSRLGVEMLCGRLIDEARNSNVIDWEKIHDGITGDLKCVTTLLGPSYKDAVYDYLLFSFVGFIVHNETVSVFYLGDGAYMVNDTLTYLGPFPNNAPPYISYVLFGNKLHFEVVSHKMCDVTSVAVATDGIAYMEEPQVFLHDVCHNDKIFLNPDALRRRLALMNLEKVVDGRIVHGPLRDDTTIVVARRF